MATVTNHLDEKNLENVYLIWLDASINSSKDNFAIQKQLHSTINHLKTFSNVNECEHYLEQISQDDRIFLIASGRFGQEIVPKIHHYRQIVSIYVYCMDKKINELWAKNFPKVRIFRSVSNLRYTSSSFIFFRSKT